MADLTLRTMAGELPFEESFERRVEMLKDVPVSKARAICAEIPLNRRILSFIQSHRENSFIVTCNLDLWIQPLLDRIGVRAFTSTATSAGDRLTGIRSILRKKSVMRGLEGPFVAVGDGNNDAELLMAADIGIAFGGVHEPARSLLEVSTHLVYDERTLCELLKRLS